MHMYLYRMCKNKLDLTCQTWDFHQGWTVVQGTSTWRPLRNDWRGSIWSMIHQHWRCRRKCFSFNQIESFWEGEICYMSKCSKIHHCFAKCTGTALIDVPWRTLQHVHTRSHRRSMKRNLAFLSPGLAEVWLLRWCPRAGQHARSHTSFGVCLWMIYPPKCEPKSWNLCNYLLWDQFILWVYTVPV